MGGETGKHSGFGGWEKLRQFGQNEEDVKRDTGKMQFNKDAGGDTDQRDVDTETGLERKRGTRAMKQDQKKI